MTTPELISYIKKQINNNTAKNLIISKLLGVGWHRQDIDEGFLSVESESKPTVPVAEIKKEVELPKIEPKKENLQIEDFKAELPMGESPKVEAPKVWVPRSVPIIEKQEIKVVENENKPAEVIKLEDSNKEELIPTLVPKPVVNSSSSINNNLVKDNIAQAEPPKSFLIKNLPQGAMLASYEKDLLSVSQTKKEVVKKDYKGLVKWSMIILIIIVIITGITWAFLKGFINIENINFSFIKKDPKVILLNNSKVLTSLKSYKTETNIEISSPSFANISAGLISGEAVISEDKDSISIKTESAINQDEGSILSDDIVTIRSSIFEDPITTNIKNNGTDLFVDIPDLSQIIKENAPEPTGIKINEQQFELIPPLFSDDLATKLKKINIYKIISSGMPAFINNETLGVYNEFIDSVKILEKGQEKIKDIDTYHYSINPDKQLSKKLLTKISDNFTLNLSDEDKVNLEQILGSITIDSFDVWVGKGDSNIYQYNVVLDVPLSKIINFEDKSIGDNKVTLDWKTTYYDFNIHNEISIPETPTPVIDFVNSVKEMKIKNDVSSFRQLATDLFNIEGKYGSKVNKDGSCMNPISGSLFSPTGHSKEATTAISAISESLNKILKTTYGTGLCYSTSKDWSFTIPISSDYDPLSSTASENKSFFCIDSTGSTIELITPPNGVLCK